jgi:hypothetical protein
MITSFINRELGRRGVYFGATKTQLPVTIQQAEVSANARSPHVVPALVTDLGDEAVVALWRILQGVLHPAGDPREPL